MSMSNQKWTTALVTLKNLLSGTGDAIHHMGYDALEHAQKHGDGRRVLELYQIQVDTIARARGFLVWVEKFSPVRVFDTKNGITVKLLGKSDEGYTPFDLPKAKATRMVDVSEAKERVTQPLSVDGFMKVLQGYKAKITKAKSGEKYKIEGSVTALEKLVDNVITDAVSEKAKVELRVVSRKAA